MLMTLVLLIVSNIQPLTLTKNTEAVLYVNSDWIVSSDENWDNETIVLTGNLIIENSGKLILDNITLKMNYAFTGQYIINVTGGGELEIRNSIITTNHPEVELYYYFKVFGIMNMMGTEVSFVRGENSWYEGIQIFSDDVVIDYCTLYNNVGAIACIGSRPTIINSKIYNSIGRSIGIWANGYPSIINCDLSNNGDGLIVDGASAQVVNSTITNNVRWGVFCSGYSTVYLLNTTVQNNGDYDLKYNAVDQIVIQNWLDLDVKDQASSPIPFVNITADDVNGDLEWEGHTDDQGHALIPLTTRKMGRDAGYYTPHNITASKDFYSANWTEYYVDQSMSAEIRLEPLPVPTPYTVYGKVDETPWIPAVGANVTCTVPGYGSLEGVTDASGYFDFNLGNIAGYVASPGDDISIDIEHPSGGIYGVQRTLDGSPPQDLGIFELGELNITLRLGWNLFALPGNVGGWEMKEMCGSLEAETSFYVLSVSWYTSGMWKDYLWRDGTPPYPLLDGTGGYPNLHDVNNVLVKLGRGYMIYWEIPIAGLEAAIETSFNQGWALLAAPYHTGLTVTADDILDQINAQNGGAGTCTKVCNWTTTDTWDTWDGTVGDDFLLDDENNPNDANAKAWAVYATKSGSWTPL